MIKNDRISSYQFCLLIVAFLFGSVSIFSPATIAMQDAWLAHLIGWGGGLILIVVYVSISLLNPNKTLIEILKYHFGKYIGSFIGLFYVWYALHIASLIIRSFGEFMVSVNYTTTPTVVIVFSIIMVISYSLKKGLEVATRVNQITVLFLLFSIGLSVALSFPLYDYNQLLPFGEYGFTPIIKSGTHLLAFPFGETVLLLMIFPAVKEQKKLLKSSLLGVFIAGLLLLVQTIRDILVLGPAIIAPYLFPPYMSVSLIPQVVVEPVVSANLFLSAGFQAFICLFSGLVGICQIFGLDDYKPLVLPTTFFVASMSFWVHESYTEAFTWSAKYWTIYSIPFQLLIPLVLLGMSLINRKKSSSVPQ